MSGVLRKEYSSHLTLPALTGSYKIQRPNLPGNWNQEKYYNIFIIVNSSRDYLCWAEGCTSTFNM